MTRESEPRAPASAESGLAGWRRRASPQLPPQLPKRDAAWHGDPRGTEVPRGHRTPSCPLGCEQPWGARGQGGAPHKSPNPEGWDSLPKVRPQARDPGARSRLGHETGMHAPSLGLCLSPQTTPGVCPGPTLGPPQLPRAKGWLEVPAAGRPTHVPGHLDLVCWETVCGGHNPVPLLGAWTPSGPGRQGLRARREFMWHSVALPVCQARPRLIHPV